MSDIERETEIYIEREQKGGRDTKRKGERQFTVFD